jgi:hypothetical protein
MSTDSKHNTHCQTGEDHGIRNKRDYRIGGSNSSHYIHRVPRTVEEMSALKKIGFAIEVTIAASLVTYGYATTLFSLYNHLTTLFN